MSLATFVFLETSPSSATTLASSVAVQGADSRLPAGVAGPLDDYDAISIVAELIGATGGTLDVYLQTSGDMGITWIDYLHFPQLAAGAAAIRFASSSSNFSQATAATVVGKNLVPALAANTSINGAFTDRMRLVMVGGVGTTVGAAVKVTLCAQRARDRQ